MKIPRILKRWWFWAATIIVVLAASYFLFPRGEEVRFVTEVVEPGLLTQTVDSSGEVVSIDEVELSFDLSGTVDQVLVSVGDVVEPNDLLIVLDTTELIANVQSAYQAVQVAQANLDRQRAGSSDEAVAVSSAAVDRAQATLDAADVDVQTTSSLLTLITAQYDASVESARLSAQTANDNYTQTQAVNTQALADAYDDLFSAAWGGLIEVRSGLSQSDEVLGVRDGFSNDDYERVLSAQDSVALSNARSAFYLAEASVQLAESSMSTIGYDSSDSSLYAAAQDVEEALENVADLLLYTRQVLDATITDTDFTAVELSTIKSSVDAVRASVQIDQAAVENAFQAVENTIDTTTNNLQNASNALFEAQANYVSVQATRDYQVASATQSHAASQATRSIRATELAQAQASLIQTKAEPRNVDLASYEAEVERTKAAYASAAARLENAEIRTPIAGIVTEVALEVGEQVVAATPIITVQTTEDQFEIVADISESDIAKLELQDKVILTFDAFGDDVEVLGFVGEINPAEKLVDSVVYYEITVYLDAAEQSIALRPGMSADLEILTAEKEAVFSLPQRAVLEDESGKYVRVLVDGQPIRRGLETGLRGDLGRIEVISGLEEGDEVIIREIDD